MTAGEARRNPGLFLFLCRLYLPAHILGHIFVYMNNAQMTNAARAILEANLDMMTAKSGLSREAVMQAIKDGVPNAVKMFRELTIEGIKIAEAHYA